MEWDEFWSKKPPIHGGIYASALKHPHKQKPSLFDWGKLESCIHARMIIGKSPLKADLCYVLNMIESPLWLSEIGLPETAHIFFFESSLFDHHRRELEINLLHLLSITVIICSSGYPELTTWTMCKYSQQFMHILQTLTGSIRYHGWLSH